MMTVFDGSRRVREASLIVLAAVLAAQAVSAAAQDTLAETRIRAIEAQVRALQRKVFPSGDGKVFGPEIVAPTTAGAAPAANAVGDLASRLDSVEAQLRRLTAQSEENGNKLAQLEARFGANAPANAGITPAEGAPATGVAAAASTPAPVAAAPAPGLSTPASNLAAMTGGASAPRTGTASRLVPAASAPSAQRVAAVRAILKPQTDDAGDDEYSYGYRLWEAKFYPEAEQQLKMMIDRYPRHARVSYARNLLGRSFLDDGKPREAATWFLQNYQASKTGERAPDSLLLLAESMRQLGDTNRACIALAEFSTNFPREAAGRLKAQYETTRGGVKCN